MLHSDLVWSGARGVNGCLHSKEIIDYRHFLGLQPKDAVTMAHKERDSFLMPVIERKLNLSSIAIMNYSKTIYLS